MAVADVTENAVPIESSVNGQNTPYDERSMPKTPTLKESWITFGDIILNPFAILPILATLLSFIAMFFIDDAWLFSFGSLISAFLAGITGTALYEGWKAKNSLPHLASKGSSAIRSLDQLYSQLQSVENRIKYYLSLHEQRRLSKELTTALVEELVLNLHTSKNTTINSVSDWLDTVPEANDLIQRVWTVRRQDELLEKLASLEKQHAQEKAESQKQIRAKKRVEKELEIVQSQLASVTFELNESRYARPYLSTGASGASTVLPTGTIAGGHLGLVADAARRLAESFTVSMKDLPGKTISVPVTTKPPTERKNPTLSGLTGGGDGEKNTDGKKSGI